MKIDNGSLPPEADAFLQCRRVIIDQAALAVLGARAAWAALEHVTVMQQPVEHRTNCGNIAEQLAPVLHGTIDLLMLVHSAGNAGQCCRA